jgi:SAM-dependent methyltransferase
LLDLTRLSRCGRFLIWDDSAVGTTPTECRIGPVVEQVQEDVNRRWFVEYARRTIPAGGRVLDYGCGAGELVELLLAAGFDAYGCDVRWPGADYHWVDLPEAERFSYFEPGGRLPFDDESFDLVVSDQVFEHVEPIEESIPEVERVVKSTGVMYHHFPTREVWREGHIGIPFSHRMPAGRARLLYTTALRRLGLGIYKDERPAGVWAAEKLDWIDNWTVYRSEAEIHALFGRRSTVRHREIDYCRFRAADRRPLKALLDIDRLTPFYEATFRHLAFTVLECRPRDSAA